MLLTLAYLVPLILFVILLVRLNLNPRLRDYMTPRVNWAMLIMFILPLINLYILLCIIWDVCKNWSYYKMLGKEQMTQRAIDSLKALDTALIRLIDKIKNGNQIDS